MACWLIWGEIGDVMEWGDRMEYRVIESHQVKNISTYIYIHAHTHTHTQINNNSRTISFILK